MHRILRPGLLVAALLGTALSPLAGANPVPTPPLGSQQSFGEAPEFPTTPLTEETEIALETAFGENLEQGLWGTEQTMALGHLGQSKDPRLAWILSDFMRVSTRYEERSALAAAATDLLGLELAPGNPWSRTVDHLTAWDIPAPPDYLTYKRRILTGVVPEWASLLVDGPEPQEIDWRVVTWGGVGIDLRAAGQTDAPCNCIPAADDPAVTSAAEASWLDDRDIVFGITRNGESRAYPRRIMEVREMVNDTLGGEALGIPYCTLCGSAQAYLTDRGEQRIVLRTSGLLTRSNKVMFDLKTRSIIDTFRGVARNGKLAEEGLVLGQISVITTTWGEWRRAHPETTVLDEALALGKDFDFRNNRDAEGPIFPVGIVDPRLGVHTEVLGVRNAAGTAIAFPAEEAKKALLEGESVSLAGVRLVLDAGGLRAENTLPDRPNPASHLAFWFAWSQFCPDTHLWAR